MVNRAQDRQLWGQMLGLHDYSQVTTKLFKSVLSISAQITSCKNNPSLLDCILGIVMQMATKLGNVAVSGSKQCYVTIVETPPILLTIGIHIDITFSPHTKPTMNSKRLEETGRDCLRNTPHFAINDVIYPCKARFPILCI